MSVVSIKGPDLFEHQKAGLTKETDERVAKYGESHYENNKNKCQ